jgi:hypothetical protein
MSTFGSAAAGPIRAAHAPVPTARSRRSLQSVCHATTSLLERPHRRPAQRRSPFQLHGLFPSDGLAKRGHSSFPMNGTRVSKGKWRMSPFPVSHSLAKRGTFLVSSQWRSSMSEGNGECPRFLVSPRVRRSSFPGMALECRKGNGECPRFLCPRQWVTPKLGRQCSRRSTQDLTHALSQICIDKWLGDELDIRVQPAL